MLGFTEEFCRIDRSAATFADILTRADGTRFSRILRLNVHDVDAGLDAALGKFEAMMPVNDIPFPVGRVAPHGDRSR